MPEIASPNSNTTRDGTFRLVARGVILSLRCELVCARAALMVTPCPRSGVKVVVERSIREPCVVHPARAFSQPSVVNPT